MGFVDRGGGREAKGSSLRRSKKNPGAPSISNQSQHKDNILSLTRSASFPPFACTEIISNMIEYARYQATRNSFATSPSSLIHALSEHEESALVQTPSMLCKTPHLYGAVWQLCEFLNISGLPQNKVMTSIRSTGVCHSLLPIQRHIDASAAILSRRLEFDQAGLYRRAVEEGKLSAVLCWCSEQNRQSTLVETCKENNKLFLSGIQQLRDSVVFGDKKKGKCPSQKTIEMGFSI
ncbi:unnamed protein product [Phytomonas sp. Hart1]|nr:unnamed protein product [Phytomonas sp. Hart1]|eukprot:CCW68863.1 unnamed protein product [Phytomonas sp. isolate Hart1]